MKTKDQIHQTRRNEFRKEYVKKLAESLKLDAKKEERISAQKCLVCFYSMQVGARAMTVSSCSLCKMDINNTSTLVNKICGKCAIIHEACTQCCGDMD